VRDGRLSGATLLGDLSDARELRGLIASGGVVPDALLEVGAPGEAAEPDHLVCSCQVVSAGDIRSAIAEFSLTTVEGVSERTGASTGCGGCRPDVEKLLLTP